MSSLNRLGVFFFYDADGIVDDYIIHLLKNIKSYTKKILIVCNGKLTIDGREKFSSITDDIIVRENKGFDVWAYKEGIKYIGWDKLERYDELLLFNSTFFGPITSFNEMFEELESKELDFWGITKHHKMPYDPFGTIKYGYTPEHIQSHFIAVRRKMFSSYEFKTYWEDMPQVNSYEEAIGYHEAVFTKHFEDKGFKWEVFVNTDDLEDHVYHPILMMPLELIKNRKSPIIKRRSFFHNMADFLNNTTGEQSLEAYEYIRSSTSFDTNLIWKNILRTNNQSDIKNAMNHNYVLSSSVSKVNAENLKLALVLHIYFEDLIEYCFDYAQAMPSHTDVYITTNSEKMKSLIMEKFSKMVLGKLTIIIIQNRGRDVSSLLVGVREYLLAYDYVCFAHDKKTKQLLPYIKGESFSYKCFENILKNKHFVNNIISTFEENPSLGILSPPPPNHADFYPTIGLEWSTNIENTKKLADKLKVKVDINWFKEPVAPLGTMFWFRPLALKPLLEYEWKYSDFPEEPNDNDGTILHAFERIYPFISQSEGYYPAWVLVDSFARIELTNLYYMLRQINLAYFEKCGPSPHYGMVTNLKKALKPSWKYRVKLKLKKYLPTAVTNVLKRIKTIVR